ncbi:MAG: hypothetical protein QGH37_30060, partial [Candidatus Poribacteria bacterium]|nr:hypothetical protein [Candidatus Poribacteria bacterium]
GASFADTLRFNPKLVRLKDRGGHVQPGVSGGFQSQTGSIKRPIFRPYQIIANPVSVYNH